MPRVLIRREWHDLASIVVSETCPVRREFPEFTPHLFAEHNATDGGLGQGLPHMLVRFSRCALYLCPDSYCYLDPFTECRAAAAFQVFDHEGTNTVDVRELGAIIRSLGLCPTEAELNSMTMVCSHALIPLRLTVLGWSSCLHRFSNQLTTDRCLLGMRR